MIDLNDAGLPSPFDNRRFYARPLIRQAPPEQLSLLPAAPATPPKAAVALPAHRCWQAKQSRVWEGSK